MEKPRAISPVPESGKPRYCPHCGSRVADLASDCLMCGASLNVEEELSPQEPTRTPRQIPWRGIVASLVTVVGFLALLWLLIRSQIVGYSVTPTPVYTPTISRAPTQTPTPTNTPEPTLTPTPIPPLAHQVRQGETCDGIATQYDVTREALAGLNPEKCPDGVLFPGDLLRIPVAPPTVGPGTPFPTSQCPIIHVVQAGETALGIAERYNVALSVIQAANPDKDLSQLQVNQPLIIPCGTPMPSFTPTPDPRATPTPIPKYPSPALLSPPDRAVLTTEIVSLQWTAVSLLRENEVYAVRLRRLDTNELLDPLYTRTTLVRLDQAFAPLPGELTREYNWEVTVVREMGISASGKVRYTAASFPSGNRTFRWLAPTPEPTSSATPVP